MTSTDTSLADRPLTRTPLTLEDAPALTALLNRIDAADDLGEPAEIPSIRELLTMPGLDLERDTLAVRDEEALIGFTVVDVHTSLDRDERVRCQLMGGVDPSRRRQGLGASLFAWAEERAAQLAAERHSAEAEAVFRAAGGRDPDLDAGEDAPLTGGAGVRPLLESRGYRRARSWLVMLRELPGAALPEIEREQVRVSAPADEDSEATRLAHLAAFADHWGSAPVSAERWNRWWFSHTARRELASIALDADGTVLAYVIASEDKPGVLHIALVGTRPEARGRGLARAVLARTLAAAAETGYASAELEVDAESLTGATRLYDALGFARDAVYATFEKPVGRLV
ncbi:GNAT family N-acetyltransferase [Brachybacterium vulturis]|uniref:GNAT family N-acetyltransferase n=1 Tax=Brachybacterium vulturis TaxID=2017484 RepID=UPI001FEABA37|nr:GNAT family N-acetyltransferase [Brachybacterium vulturis]